MKPVTPKVQLVGLTEAFIPEIMDTDDGEVAHFHPQHLMEFAGRNCYQSFHKPNEATRSNWDYITNILKQKHYSVLEHASVSFYLAGVSRNFTHELVRHRHMSFSELSGRYVDPVKAGLGYVIPPATQLDEWERPTLDYTFESAEDGYKDELEVQEANGVKGKKAREAARAHFPGSLETRIVVTANIRSWMEFVSKRDHPAADAEMQQVAATIYGQLKLYFPAVFEQRELWDDQWAQEAPKRG
ncbi:ThyX-like thymidylate synthase [Gordonia phage Octobien14]|uniref:ThyX-like thymidylate synthase n=1 Tax=Gordonia phage Octobien14 TaxID=2483673 RepID=A0A3G3MBA9_9CAUD|nr:thymidylate synthase [Gordonia phage Octobien14]AYR03244.1 ThyX-like thymidylate synthase [Gordonia phage Octobien14]